MATAELAERFLRALETRDVDEVMPLWNDDGVMEFPYVPEGSPSRFEGADAIRTTLASAFIQRTRMRFFDVTAYQAEDPDLAFVEFKGDMTLQSGAPYNNTYIAKAEARNGKLTYFKEFFNPLVDLAAGNPREAENQ
ncbi:nuclear transport factor 2 family protein [Roseobacter weihaiensis]|uniref:nuclear transport factor 2 family protein n=1 Tax=Roseobacter weihaiensis TaxID=2763262 RepID=UPI001D0A22E2|nr:nuclear transport factor 2 family protein [Roseobacter sp. H9]